MLQGRISGLFVYPVKGCRGIALDQATLGPLGLEHDRRFLVVRPDGRFLSQRELPAMATVVPAFEDGALALRFGGSRHLVDLAMAGPPMEVTIWKDRFPALTGDPATDQALSDHLGRPVRLVRFDPEVERYCRGRGAPPGTRTSFVDDFPILLTSTASLTRLNDQLQEAGGPALPMDRFRPNIVVDGLPAYAEDDHPYAVADGIRLALASACERCIVPTTDQESGERTGPEPIRTLKRYHADDSGRPLFGQNAVWLDDGKPAPALRIGALIGLHMEVDA
ncbi:MOSC domain-containing protein [Geminicoccus roseus]|uniref:MOSC domain-containing protein n=1 Tax=Geminicoccus roseus TaxID=404900 RepID=UPI0004272AAD|nr:MOSC N-terminal beta barrel domain-containing protein [Geminicoccus roseus]